MSKRWWLLGGVLAPLLYLTAVVVGGIITPGYSHMGNAISDLMAAGAPNKSLMDPWFLAYNLFVIGFGVGLPTRAGRLIIATGICGFVLTAFFPVDLHGAPMTTVGKVHIALSGVISFLTMAGILAVGWQEKALKRYSVLSVIFVFVTGGLSAYTMATASPIFGLFERLTIGGFLQWVLVVALYHVRRSAPPVSPGRLTPAR